MHSQSAFTFSYPLAAAKSRSFAGEGLMNFSNTPFSYPFASSALGHLNTDQQYSNFHSNVDDDLALFLMGDGAVTSRVIDDDTALGDIFSLGDWIDLEDQPWLASGSIPNPIHPVLSKEGDHPIPSSSATGAGLVKETLDLYGDPLESFKGLPYFVNDKFGRAESALKVTVPHMVRPHSLPAIKQADSVPHEHVRLSDVNPYGNVGDIHNAVDLTLTVDEYHPDVQSVYAPLPHTVPAGPSPVPAPASSSRDLAEPVNPPKASALPAKRNPRKRSKVDEDEEDFVDGPALKKRRARATEADSTTRAPGAVQCELCDKWCDNANDMSRHMMKANHGAIKLPCLVGTCSTDFTREDSLKRHLINKHRWVFPNPEWDAWLIIMKQKKEKTPPS